MTQFRSKHVAHINSYI